MSHVAQHRPGTPSWFDLSTPDIDHALAFYAAVFGWTFDKGPPEAGFYTMCKAGGHNAAGIGQPPPDDGMTSAWTPYFSVESVDAAGEEMAGRGGNIVMGPMDVFDAGRLAIATDPTGAVFGLWQPRSHKGAQVVKEHGAMAWCEVNTRDAVAARDFYTGLFGLGAKPMEPSPGMEYYALDAGDDEPIAGVLQMTEEWGDMPPHWMVYFAVDDADAATVAIAEAGGVVAHGPFDTPVGRMAVAKDPAGAAFSVIQLRSA